MFRRKKDNEDEPRALAPEPPQMSTEPRVPARPNPPAAPQVVMPAMTPRAAPPASAGVPVVAAARPASAGMSLAQRPGPAVEAESKKLIVGRDIMLSGKITSCDRLVVEGRVEADLSETRSIEISPNGIFKGTAEIDQAEIAGRFEGTITVRQRLFIRATGKVVGTIRYGTVEIEAGGEIAGDVQVSGTRGE
jgi:cytoskeletal protein CcmA (bactofilin family)